VWGYWCCLRGRHRWVCLADNLNHLLPEGFQWRWICDRHDRLLTAQMMGDLPEDATDDAELVDETAMTHAWDGVSDFEADTPLEDLLRATSRPPDGYTQPPPGWTGPVYEAGER
jgi:hypothetical protein